MVVNVDRRRSRGREAAAGRSRAVVWHDLECGCYTADLPLWHELAGAAGSRPVLDIGAGAGRVALDLARRGHRVTAVERDAELAAALRERALQLQGDGGVETVCADARSLALATDGFGLCVVAMQTIQMFGGARGRQAFLRAARAHLAPGGVLACAIVTDVEEFDRAGGELGPSAERVRVGAAEFVSQATRVHVSRHTLRIERERRILPVAQAPTTRPRGSASSPPAPPAPPVEPWAPVLEHDVVELDRLSVAQLQREGREARFTVLRARCIPATAEHTGSVAVMFRA